MAGESRSVASRSVTMSPDTISPQDYHPKRHLRAHDEPGECAAGDLVRLAERGIMCNTNGLVHWSAYVNLWRLAKNAADLSYTKRIVCAVALSVCFAENFRTSAQGTKSGKEDSYIIRGTVVNSVTHAPIGRALVYSTDNRFAKMTDDQGHFELKVPLRESEQTRPSG